MNFELINQAIESAYQQALQNPQIVPPQEIKENVMLHTETYISPNGNGFRVVCRILHDDNETITFRVKNYGPDIRSERSWTTFKPLY
jgi:hypothetical protein